jgi:retinol dehydrogenase-12
VGKELAQILDAHDAKVYVAAKSKERARQVVGDIRVKILASKGELLYLHLDLEGLFVIKVSVEEFPGKEDRLDVLWNNAAVMNTPAGSKTKQGYELQLGTNNIAPFLFTKLLTPVLVETAKTAPKGSVRVVWVSSSAAEMIAPVGGVDMNNLDYKKELSGWMKYGVSKGGNILHSNEFAKRHEEDGIISVVG